MIEEQTLAIDFGQGIDTKTDPKLVVPGKLLRLENATFSAAKEVAKRNGYKTLPTAVAGGGAAISSPQLIQDYGSQLVCVDQGRVLSLSSSSGYWENKGVYIGNKTQRSPVDQSVIQAAYPSAASGYADCAVMGNYALYAWSTLSAVAGAPGPTTVFSSAFATVVDLATGVTIGNSGTLPITTGNSGVTVPIRCVVLGQGGGTQVLAVIYANGTKTNVCSRVVTISGGIATFSAEQNVSQVLTPFVWGATGTFDVTPTSTGAVVLFSSNPSGTSSITLQLIDTTGNPTGTNQSLADVNRSTDVLHVSTTPTNGNIWAYWISNQGSSGTTINYVVYNSTLTSSVLAKTTAVTITVVAGHGVPWYSNFVAVPTGIHSQTLYWSGYSSTASSPTQLYTDITSSINLTDGGAVSGAATVCYGALPMSRIATINGQSYGVFLYRGGSLGGAGLSQLSVGYPSAFALNQLTYFLLQLDPTQSMPAVVSRFGSSIANSQLNLLKAPGFMPNLCLDSGSKYRFACALETQTLPTGDKFYPDYYGAISSVFSYSFNFGSGDVNMAATAGQAIVLNGGCPQYYDGGISAEFGFHLAPEIISVAQATGAGGSIAAGSYSYIAVFQWTDALGNLHQSAVSFPMPVTVSSASTTNTVTVTVAYLSRKPNVSVSLYRTTASGGVYYQVSDPVALVQSNQYNQASCQFTDIYADGSIIGNLQAYTYPGNSVNENGVVPPSTVMTAHNNRLWLVNDEVPNEIWYTKSYEPGVGLSPSALMLEQIDPKLGNISALAEMDDKLIIFKAKGICVQSGDGSDDTGANNSLSFPQFIPSDVGCDQLKSVISTPDGVVFHTPNGIYLLSRALGVGYLGAEVEQYNSQTITSALMTPGKSQIRFLCSSGLTLVYDYIFKQWSTFTNHTGLSAAIFQGAYTYATTGGSLFQEQNNGASPYYLDNGAPFQLLAQLSWLSLAKLQGFQRVRLLELLGDIVNGANPAHGMLVEVAYDFASAFTALPTFAPNASGSFAFRERLPIQKCTALSLRFTEQATGDSLETIDFTDMALEAGVKKGLRKMSQTVVVS